MKVSSDPVHWLVHGYIQFFSENFRQASRSFSQALSANKGSFMAGYFSGQIPIAQRKNRICQTCSSSRISTPTNSSRMH